MSWKYALYSLRPDYWTKAFYEGYQNRIIRDGHYEPSVDRDVLLMYCMGEPV